MARNPSRRTFLSVLGAASTATFSVTGFATGYGDARTAVCQIDGLKDAPAPATATIGFSDTPDVQEDRLIAGVGNLGTDRTYVRDGQVVRVGCEYSEDALSQVLGDSGIGT